MDEQHPVPQDVTGFQFKLVGDMTLKQFGELAGGMIVAYIFYASGWHPFIKWPLVLSFGFLGVALAFIPVEERPLDVWILNFFKSIYRPTYYVWKKGTTNIAMAAPQTTPIVPVAPVAPPEPPNEQSKVEEKIVVPSQPVISIDQLTKMREEKLVKVAPAPTPSPIPERVKVEEKVEPTPPAQPLTVDKLAEMRAQKAPEVTPPWAAGGSDQVRVVDRPTKQDTIISLTGAPNIINGTVFDQKGGPIEGVVMIIKDSSGNSVRALKTNRVGQFIVGTPLPDGHYFLEFELKGYVFNTYEVVLNGTVIKPIEIKGKFI